MMAVAAAAAAARVTKQRRWAPSGRPPRRVASYSCWVTTRACAMRSKVSWRRASFGCWSGWSHPLANARLAGGHAGGAAEVVTEEGDLLLENRFRPMGGRKALCLMRRVALVDESSD